MTLGRPKIEINWDVVDDLCEVQCTSDEICAALKISEDTLERACKRDKKCLFADYSKQKRRAGFVSLRHKQFEMAMAGDRTMLIWLGKQYLGQSENIEERRNFEKDVTPVGLIEYKTQWGSVIEAPQAGLADKKE